MVRSFLTFLLAVAPLITWGSSFQNSQSYLEVALKERLWEDPQWLRLGHYRTTWTGGLESVLHGGNFFLSPQGQTDPKAELMSTIQTLFSEAGAKAQCRYLARTTWLAKKLSVAQADLQSCPEQVAWKNELGAQEVYMVFAASDLNSVASSFGHNFLRLHNPKNTRGKELLDYGVNYAAVTGEEDGALYALKGLTGHYPGNYSMLPYHQKLREYTNLEGRNIWEYRLKLSLEEVDFLVSHLLELEGSYSHYYFINDNCARQILDLIEVAKPSVRLAPSFMMTSIPLDAVKTLAEANLLEDEKLRLSLQSDWQERYSRLGSEEKKALRNVLKKHDNTLLDHLFPREKAEVLEATLSALAIQEYRDNKDFKEFKYQLARERAGLGNLTQPLEVTKPKSPLLSPDSQAFYLGYGDDQGQKYFSLKYRHAFHDLLSDDSALNPFSELQALGFETRYLESTESFKFHQFTLLKIFNSLPVNDLDTPLTWSLDIGTKPKLVPYLDFGVGYSYDYHFAQRTRLVGLLKSHNSQLHDQAVFKMGPEILLLSKWEKVRSLFGLRYLYDLKNSENERFSSFAGVSFDVRQLEFRAEVSAEQKTSSFQLSVIF